MGYIVGIIYYFLNIVFLLYIYWQIYDFDRDYKDIGVSLFTTKSFVVRNCLPNAKSDMLLSAWNAPPEWGKYGLFWNIFPFRNIFSFVLAFLACFYSIPLVKVQIFNYGYICIQIDLFPLPEMIVLLAFFFPCSLVLSLYVLFLGPLWNCRLSTGTRCQWSLITQNSDSNPTWILGFWSKNDTWRLIR